MSCELVIQTRVIDMTSDKSPAGRRYAVRFRICMVAYVIVLLGVAFWFRSAAAPTGAFRYVVAAAPALPVLGVIWAMGAYMLELPDEYQRMRLATDMLWATGITVAACTVWGFLQTYADAPAAPLYLVFVLLMAVLGLVQCGRKLLERRS
jgi:hypothetical protein